MFCFDGARMFRRWKISPRSDITQFHATEKRVCWRCHSHVAWWRKKSRDDAIDDYATTLQQMHLQLTIVKVQIVTSCLFDRQNASHCRLPEPQAPFTIKRSRAKIAEEQQSPVLS